MSIVLTCDTATPHHKKSKCCSLESVINSIRKGCSPYFQEIINCCPLDPCDKSTSSSSHSHRHRHERSCPRTLVPCKKVQGGIVWNGWEKVHTPRPRTPRRNKCPHCP